MNRDGIGGAAHLMILGQECEQHLCDSSWCRHRWRNGRFEWQHQCDGNWERLGEGLPDDEWRLYTPEPAEPHQLVQASIKDLKWYEPEAIHRARFAKCPTCGKPVFLPTIGSQQVYHGSASDPIVFCSDMGHWIGRLSHCGPKTAPDLPTPTDGCELWEVYSDKPHGHTLYVRPVGEKHTEASPMLGELPSDARWTGRAWWRNEKGYRVFGDARLRWNGNAPAYIEMNMETP